MVAFIKRWDFQRTGNFTKKKKTSFLFSVTKSQVKQVWRTHMYTGLEYLPDHQGPPAIVLSGVSPSSARYKLKIWR